MITPRSAATIRCEPGLLPHKPIRQNRFAQAKRTPSSFLDHPPTILSGANKSLNNSTIFPLSLKSMCVLKFKLYPPPSPLRLLERKGCNALGKLSQVLNQPPSWVLEGLGDEVVGRAEGQGQGGQLLSRQSQLEWKLSPGPAALWCQGEGLTYQERGPGNPRSKLKRDREKNREG
jgi:hypothetical protein